MSAGPRAARRAPLRVAYSIDSLDLGGTELNAVRTLEHLDRSRIDPVLICFRPDGPLRERVEAAGVPIEHVPLTSLMNASALAAGWHIARFVRRNRIDVLHAHDVYSNILSVPWARLAGVPRVIASRRWWTVTARASQRTANRLAYRFAHRVLANAPSIGEMLMRDEDVPRGKVVLVPNFVDEDAFAPPAPHDAAELARSFGLASGAPSVGIVANLSPVKDHATLLRAVARLAPEFPGLRVVLVGDGACRAALEALVLELGVGRYVHFAGRMAHNPGMQALFDVVVLCSREEGFPNTVVEAMAAGRPVVASRVGGIVDAVVEEGGAEGGGATGVLFPAGDHAALAGALRLLLNDPERCATMGVAGQHRARALYHVDRVMAELYAVYEGLGPG